MSNQPTLEEKAMEQLTIEQLAPYLPYRLKLKTTTGVIGNMIQLNESSVYIDSGPMWDSGSLYGWMLKCDVKPLLRPLSQLTEEIEHNGERFVPMAKLLEIAYPQWMREKAGTLYAAIECKSDGWYEKAYFKYHAVNSIELHKGYLHNEPYWKIEYLLKYHFDVFGLADKGLAIPIPSLK